MKLPHVTIEYREEESFAIGKMSPTLIFGFGLHWAWVYLVMYNNHTLFPMDYDSYQTPFFIISLATFTVVLLCYGVFLKQARQLFTTAHQRKRNRIVAAACMSASTLLLFPIGTPGPLSLFCGIAAGVLSGAGSAIILMSFGVSFSICDVATSSISAALALIVSAGSYGLIVFLETILSPIGGIICAIMPFVELWCLTRCSRQLTDNLEFQTSTIPVKIPSFSWHICLSSLVMGMVLGLARGQALSVSATLPASQDFALVVTLAGVAACIVVILAMLTQRQTSYFMFRTLLPVIALLFAAMITPLGTNATLYAFGLFMAYFMLEACMWIALADISQRYRISAFTVFGLGRSAMAAGTLVAVLATPDTAIGSLFDDTSTFVILTLALLIFGHALLPTSAEVRSTLDRGKLCPAFFDDEEITRRGIGANAAAMRENASPAVNAQVPADTHADMHADVPADARGGACERSHAVEDASRPDALATGATTERSDALAVNAAASRPADTGSGSAGSAADDGRLSATHESRQVADAQTPTRLANASVSASSSQHAASDRQREAADERSFERFGRYKRKCLAIANTYLLSRKETEVLFLLAKGYNSAAIQKSLYISAGTANTHMRNIYRKINVHSQQELIALVESVRSEADQPE